MATVGGWLQTAISWLFDDVLGMEVYGIRIRLVVLSLAVLSALVRFFVVPFFAGSFSHAGSDFVKLRHRSHNDE